MCIKAAVLLLVLFTNAFLEVFRHHYTNILFAVRTAKFVPRKNWVVTGSVSIAYSSYPSSSRQILFSFIRHMFE